AVAVQSARPVNGVTAQAATPASMQADHRGGLTYYASRAACTAANPGLLTEDFLEADLSSGTSGTMPNPLDENTNNAIFQPGDILSGLAVESVGPLAGDPAALFIIKDSAHTGVFVGSNYDEDDTQLRFAPGVAAVCVDYYNPGGGTSLTVEVYDTGGNLLGSTSGSGSSARSFFGVSSAGAAIGSVVFITPAGS